MALLFAAHAHDQGLTAEANALAGLLLELSDNPQKTLHDAAAWIENNQIIEAYLRCLDNHDLAAFAAKLKQRNGTPNKELAALSKAVEAKLRNQPPEISGADLSDTDRQLARGLAELNNDDVEPRCSSFWIFGQYPPAQEPPDTLDKIMARGRASVPLLLALQHDQWLTNSPRAPNNFRPDGSASEFPGWFSRGEIAERLLLAIAPKDYANQTQDVIEDITDWLAANQDKADRQLALEYFEGGSKRNEVITFLLNRLTAAEAKQIEAIYLNEASTENGSLWSLENYLRTRGPEAKDFLERYLAAWRENHEEEASNDSTKQQFARLPRHGLRPRVQRHRRLPALRQAQVGRPDRKRAEDEKLRGREDQKPVAAAIGGGDNNERPRPALQAVIPGEGTRLTTGHHQLQRQHSPVGKTVRRPAACAR